MVIRFSITPFYNTRQFYHGLESGAIDPGFDLAVEHNHSPVKDQKLVSHTDVVPTDPVAVAAGLTYREGNGLFVRATDTETPTELDGARVGIHDRTLAMTYHKAVLEERFGVDPDDVKWVVDTHQRLGERMASGDLDAVERINDWYWAWRDDEDYRLLYDIGRSGTPSSATIRWSTSWPSTATVSQRPTARRSSAPCEVPGVSGSEPRIRFRGVRHSGRKRRMDRRAYHRGDWTGLRRR